MEPDNALVEKHLRHRYRDYDWQPVTLGLSGGHVYRLTGPADLHLKYAAESLHPDPGFDVGAECDRLRWLATTGVGVPEVVECDTVDEHTYLVTTTMSGRDASQPWAAHERMDVIDAVADFARDLHSLPTAGCPFDRSLRVTASNAGVAVALGQVDLDDLDDERSGWDAQRLLTELDAALRGVEPERAALCHGDFCLPNVMLDPRTLRVTGVIDVGRFGVADPYTDLALLTRSAGDTGLNPQFGAEHVARFWWRYGVGEPDAGKVALYRLLDEFC
ncbi:APH(3') family aminoglycoside O-phosphotransferase [Phytomonospora sp. NPDC050363]|uniref:APH(3') family aminoglycoside O-phosphotransferase n=1 Tax=Phytomonospora sp. NPDC050363 TaxID=3155642 RepID=UPI0033CF6F5F